MSEATGAGRARFLRVRPGFASKALDHALLLFGAWSFACHAAMFLKLGLAWAAIVFAAVYAGALAVAFRYPAPDLAAQPVPVPSRVAGLQSLGVACGAVLLAIVWIAGFAAPGLVWGFAVATLLLGVLAVGWNSGPSDGAAGEPVGERDVRRRDRQILALAAAVAVALAFLGRPNADDAFYVSLANRVASHPFEPLLWVDSLHGFGLGAQLTDFYRVHAFEAAIGALAATTGIAPVELLQVAMPPLAGFLIVLAAGRLASLVAWRDALLLLSLFVVLAFVFHNSYGFYRLQQGKHVLFMLLPLVLPVLALRFAESGHVRHGLVFLAAVVAGAGLSSSGLYFVPAAVGAAVLAAGAVLMRQVPLRALALRLAAVFATVAYPLGVLALLAATRIDFAAGPDAGGGFTLTWAPEFLRNVSESWLGASERVPQVFALATFPVFAAWAFARTRVAMAWAVGLGVGYLIVLYNPLALGLYRDVSGLAVVYNRIQFAFPLVFLLAATLLPAFAALRQPARLARPQALLGVALLGAILLHGPMLFGHWVDFARPLDFEPLRRTPVHFKAPWDTAIEAHVAHARCVADAVGPDARLLAPEGTAAAAPLARGAPRLVLHRDNNVPWIERVVGEAEAERRLAMLHWITGSRALDAQAFRQGLSALSVDAVAVPQGHPKRVRVTRLLEEAGFARTDRCQSVRIWKRRPG